MCSDGIFHQLAIGLGSVTFTIYMKITAFSVTAKGKKWKKVPKWHECLINNLWGNILAAGLATSILLPPALNSCNHWNVHVWLASFLDHYRIILPKEKVCLAVFCLTKACPHVWPKCLTKALPCVAQFYCWTSPTCIITAAQMAKNSARGQSEYDKSDNAQRNCHANFSPAAVNYPRIIYGRNQLHRKQS